MVILVTSTSLILVEKSRHLPVRFVTFGLVAHWLCRDLWVTNDRVPKSPPIPDPVDRIVEPHFGTFTPKLMYCCLTQHHQSDVAHETWWLRANALVPYVIHCHLRGAHDPENLFSEFQLEDMLLALIGRWYPHGAWCHMGTRDPHVGLCHTFNWLRWYRNLPALNMRNNSVAHGVYRLEIQVVIFDDFDITFIHDNSSIHWNDTWRGPDDPSTFFTRVFTWVVNPSFQRDWVISQVPFWFSACNFSIASWISLLDIRHLEFLLQIGVEILPEGG